MKEKTREPIPMVRLEYNKHDTMEIFMLDEGDSMAWNTSTNYDHHMSGPSLVFVRRNHGTQTTEHHVNDFKQWHYIDKMMRLGMKYLEENPDFDMRAYDEELREIRKQYKPHVSFHKNKD